MSRFPDRLSSDPVSCLDTSEVSDVLCPHGESGQPCEVIAVEPERLSRYSFAPGTLDTTITWRLEPEGSGTRLHFEQSGFDLDSPMGKAAFDGMGNGWPKILGKIGAVLDAYAEA